MQYPDPLSSNAHAGIRNIFKLVHTIVIKRQAQHEKETEEGEAIEGCMCVCM